MKIQALGDRVVIKRIKEKIAETKLASGIYIPEEKKDSTKNKGIVESLSPQLEEKLKEKKLHFKIGDTVLFSWGESIKFGEDTYDIVSESNILAVLKDK